MENVNRFCEKMTFDAVKGGGRRDISSSELLKVLGAE